MLDQRAGWFSSNKAIWVVALVLCVGEFAAALPHSTSAHSDTAILFAGVVVLNNQQEGAPLLPKQPSRLTTKAEIQRPTTQTQRATSQQEQPVQEARSQTVAAAVATQTAAVADQQQQQQSQARAAAVAEAFTEQYVPASEETAEEAAEETAGFAEILPEAVEYNYVEDESYYDSAKPLEIDIDADHEVHAQQIPPADLRLCCLRVVCQFCGANTSWTRCD